MKAKSRIFNLLESLRGFSTNTTTEVAFSFNISNSDLERVRKKSEAKFKGDTEKQIAYSMKKVSEMILNQLK